MEKSIKELDFLSLKNNFDDVCDEVNSSKKPMALTLKSGRKVFIMPEENYDNISHFIITNTTYNRLKS